MNVLTLRAEHLSRSFKSRRIVDDVTFEVRSKEVVGLLGPNGAGKTTSFYMMVGLLNPDVGQIFLSEENITKKPMYERARLGISYLPQNISIFRQLTVAENLMGVMEIAKIPAVERKVFLDELLERFHIGHIAKSLGVSLSGGERRRVEIARALIIRPKFLLLDEPFAGVDPVTVEEIQVIIKNLQSEGLGVLITDHNVRETLSSCQRVYVLSSGKVMAQGVPENIVQDQRVREIYLGESFSL